MSRVLPIMICLMFGAPASAVTGNAPPAAGWAARPIVMIVDTRDDLCTGTALAQDLVLTAAHCVARPVKYTVKTYQTDVPVPVRAIVRHPRFDFASYASSRATADIALLKLAAPLPDIVVPATLAAPRRVVAGETLTIAGFGVTIAGTTRGLGLPRMATLTVTGTPGSLQIRLYDIATRNQQIGLGGCTGDSRRACFRRRWPARHRRGQLVDRARRRRRLRRVNGRDAIAAVPRLDRRHRPQAQFTNSSLNFTGVDRSSFLTFYF
jgi:hypothetical protein